MNNRVIAVAGRTGLEPQSKGQCSGFLRTASVLKACTHRMPVFWSRVSMFWDCTYTELGVSVLGMFE